MSDENEVYEGRSSSSTTDPFVPAELESAASAERDAIRSKLEDDVEAFLASGGHINRIAPNVLADPPKKPQSNYGGQPI